MHRVVWVLWALEKNLCTFRFGCDFEVYRVDVEVYNVRQYLRLWNFV